MWGIKVLKISFKLSIDLHVILSGGAEHCRPQLPSPAQFVGPRDHQLVIATGVRLRSSIRSRSRVLTDLIVFFQAATC